MGALVTIVSRSEKNLQEAKQAILLVVPGAKVSPHLVLTQGVRQAVRRDIGVSNRGGSEPGKRSSTCVPSLTQAHVRPVDVLVCSAGLAEPGALFVRA
jgi:hypothetical protein